MKVPGAKKYESIFIIRLRAIALVLTLLFSVSVLSACGGENKSKNSTFEWPDSGLSMVLPKPKSNKGEIRLNLSHIFSMNVVGVSESDYNDYLNACVEKGFTIDSNKSTSMYRAYNESGHNLFLQYNDEEISVILGEPKHFGEFEWPDSRIGKLLPIPESTLGQIEQESSKGFVVYLGDITVDSYSDYVKRCKENGFNIDYTKDDDYYIADNKDGCHLSLSYEGFNTMRIQIEAPADWEETSSDLREPTPSTVSTQSPSDSTPTVTTEVTVNYPVEEALRAAVVAFTNRFALDVFTEDGNNYDVSKFHSYADTSGNFFDYYMAVKSEGVWSAKDEQTWHVESLKLDNSYGSAVDVSLDVSYDGKDYIISNLAGKAPSYNDNDSKYSPLSDLEKESDFSLFFDVSSDLIKDDRSQTKIDTYHEWVMNQFSSLDASHKELKKLIVRNLNDEKSFKHIDTTYQEIRNEESRNEINEMLKSSNKEARVEIGDLWITTQFSATNALNATVKNTAYAISSFAKNTINVVAIE